MLVKISFSKNDILKMDNNSVTLKIQHLGPFKDICHITTIKGWKIEDIEKGKLLKGKTIYASVNGGISL